MNPVKFYYSARMMTFDDVVIYFLLISTTLYRPYRNAGQPIMLLNNKYKIEDDS